AQGESAAAAFRLSRQSLLALLALLAGRRERDGSLCRQHQEGEGLLKVEPNRGVAVAQIADGDVLADVQREVAAALRHHALQTVLSWLHVAGSRSKSVEPGLDAAFRVPSPASLMPAASA